MPAPTLERALTTFHVAPLRGNDLKLYYVERPNSPLARMALRLKAQRQLKILFTGHRITGKTTALNRMAADLGEAFFVVHFSVLDTLNAYDVHYADLMLALATRLLQQATDKRLFPKGVARLVKEELLEDVFLWLEKHTTGLGFVSTGAGEKEVGGKVNLLAVELEAKLSTEAETRQALRERIAMHLSELLERMSYVLDEVERRAERGVLFIVEDIDKLDLENARNLFLEHARALTAPRASIIYTFPIALRWSLDSPHIKNNFDRDYILPNINLSDQAGNPDPDGHQTLVDIFHRRLNPDLVEPEALETLIAASGGLVGTLVRLGGLAAEHALVDGKKAIDLASANLAISEMRGDFKALLRGQDYEVLRRHLAGERLLNEQAVREALYTGCLLEYHNGEPWFGVHPIVRPLLEG
jgi:hypothetical protein